jgi:hypothetical protein
LNWNDPDIMEHSVLAVGAEWHPDGHIEKVLVKNSWGLSTSESLGLHWMQADYLFLLNSVEIHPRLERKFKDEGLIERGFNFFCNGGEEPQNLELKPLNG